MRRSRHARPFTNTAPRQEARATASKPRAARPSPLSRTGALPGLETGRERPPPGYYKWRDRGLSYRPDRPAAQDQEHISAEQPETALRFTAGFFCSSRTQSASHGVRPLPGTPHTPPPRAPLSELLRKATGAWRILPPGFWATPYTFKPKLGAVFPRSARFSALVLFTPVPVVCTTARTRNLRRYRARACLPTHTISTTQERV